MASFILSTIAYFIAAWLASRFLSEQGVDGFAKRVLAGIAGLLVSFVVSWGVDAIFPEAQDPVSAALSQTISQAASAAAGANPASAGKPSGSLPSASDMQTTLSAIQAAASAP